MKTKININGKDVEIELTAEQVAKITKSTKNITDRIKTYEDACAELGISISLNGGGLTEDEFAFIKLKTIAKALNEGWTPDWQDESEYKYYPYFDMRKKIGSGFCGGCGGGISCRAVVPSGLFFKSSELTVYAGKQFESIYNSYMRP